MATQEEFYATLEDLGEDEVYRGVIFKRWTNESEHKWADAWLRKTRVEREERVSKAAEASAESAKSAKTANRVAFFAIIVALIAAARSFFGQ